MSRAAALMLLALMCGCAKPAPPKTPVGTPTLRPPPNCQKLPEPIPGPDWFPGDLDLPEGSYPSEIPSMQQERVAVYTVKGSIDEFVKFVLKRWPEQGWTFGRGEREPWDAESSFVKEGRTGYFRAALVYCEMNWSLVYFFFSSATPAPAQ